MSLRNCEYPSQSPQQDTSPPITSNCDQHNELPHSPIRQIASSPDKPESSNPPVPLDPLKHLTGHDASTISDIETLNLDHMELIIHLISDKDIYSLATKVGEYSQGISFALNTGLSCPYLLYQLLAFSARHLAHLQPSKSSAYLNRAVALQTRAISLFKTLWTGDINPSNCTAILLFSSILGHHLIADMLSKRHSKGLEEFLPEYLQCLDLHKGIYTIATAAWPMLMESELGPVLADSSQFTSQTPALGRDCRALVELVDRLGDEEKDACREAIRYLQIGLDAMGPSEPDVVDLEGRERNVEMTVLWPMLVPPKFKTLLAAKRPEALILQGHYALLLHYARDMWQVGDAGSYMLRIIADYLGESWNHWLLGPLEVLAQHRS